MIGIIKDGYDDLRLEVCPENERTREIFVQLIEKHVEKDSIIHIDFRKDYFSLPQH